MKKLPSKLRKPLKKLPKYRRRNPPAGFGLPLGLHHFATALYAGIGRALEVNQPAEPPPHRESVEGVLDVKYEVVQDRTHEGADVIVYPPRIVEVK